MTRLAEIRIETNSIARTAEVFRTICGVEAGELRTADPDRIRIPLQDATLELVAACTDVVGLTSITLAVDDLNSRERALMAAGIDVESGSTGLSISREAANGVAVQLQVVTESPMVERTCARLDHVALRVKDLPAESLRWQAITGIEAEQMGLHPISGGAFSAARFGLGERMIELVAPVLGKESQIAARLASHGEGVAALALPVEDVDLVRNRLSDIGARVFHQEPHWLVHPKDAGGVLVQLTPRVSH
jgi:catechol 2,3-dioxygenase-like lactoylglutathione lyase family enzyme